MRFVPLVVAWWSIGCASEHEVKPEPDSASSAVAAATASASAMPTEQATPPTEEAEEPEPTPGKALPRVERPGRKERGEAVLTAQRAMTGAAVREVHGKDFDIVLNDVARKGLPKVKDTTIAFVKHSLDEIGASALSASDADLTVTLQGSFAAAGIAVDLEQRTGGLVALRASHPAAHPQLLAVDFSVEFGHGGDDVLCIFERTGDEFMPVLVRRFDGYESIGEARWLSTWAISPPAPDGSWFVIEARSHAWISSLWRGIRYAILEPGPRADQPKLLLQGHDSAYIGGEEAGRVSATATTAMVEYGSWDKLSGEHTRNYRRAFTREASGAFKRSAPFVWSPRELVHELVEGDASVARQMALPGVADKAAALHQRMKSAKDSATGSVVITDQPDVEVDALKSPATVVFECAGCSQLPKRIEIIAERSGDGWLIRDLTYQ